MRLGVDIHFPLVGESAPLVTHTNFDTFVVVSLPVVRADMYFKEIASIDALLSALIAARQDMVTNEARRASEL